MKKIVMYAVIATVCAANIDNASAGIFSDKKGTISAFNVFSNAKYDARYNLAIVSALIEESETLLKNSLVKNNKTLKTNFNTDVKNLKKVKTTLESIRDRKSESTITKNIKNAKLELPGYSSLAKDDNNKNLAQKITALLMKFSVPMSSGDLSGLASSVNEFYKNLQKIQRYGDPAGAISAQYDARNALAIVETLIEEFEALAKAKENKALKKDLNADVKGLKTIKTALESIKNKKSASTITKNIGKVSCTLSGSYNSIKTQDQCKKAEGLLVKLAMFNRTENASYPDLYTRIIRLTESYSKSIADQVEAARQATEREKARLLEEERAAEKAKQKAEEERRAAEAEAARQADIARHAQQEADRQAAEAAQRAAEAEVARQVELVRQAEAQRQEAARQEAARQAAYQEELLRIERERLAEVARREEAERQAAAANSATAARRR